MPEHGRGMSIHIIVSSSRSSCWTMGRRVHLDPLPFEPEDFLQSIAISRQDFSTGILRCSRRARGACPRFHRDRRGTLVVSSELATATPGSGVRASGPRGTRCRVCGEDDPSPSNASNPPGPGFRGWSTAPGPAPGSARRPCHRGPDFWPQSRAGCRESARSEDFSGWRRDGRRPDPG